MNKKTIIQIVLIVAGFAGSGVVLYNGFMGNSTSGTSLAGIRDPFLIGSSTSSSLSGQPADKVLPYGESLNFTQTLNQQNLQYNVLAYPVLATSTQVGLIENAMLSVPSQPSQ